MVDRERASILIVDDMPDKLLVYQSVLDELDEHVVAVRSGAEALKEILRQDFAVILLDVNMPGMDGFETAQLIRQRRRSAHIPLIYLTAFTDELRISQGYATGAVDYISTPVVPEILRAKVRVFTDLYRLRKQVERQAHDVARRDAAEQAARRSAFLAESSRALAQSLDYAATYGRLVSLGVPYLAELCLVSLTDEQRRLREATFTWLDPESVRESGMTRRLVKPDPWITEIIERVLASGQGEVLDLAQPALVSSEASEVPAENAVATQAPALRSLIARPLVARGKILGAIVWGNCQPGPSFTLDEISLAEELAARGGIALDNSLLVRDIQENDRRKNEFLAMLAHELRNPLAPIRNANEILRMLKSEQPELGLARDVIDRQLTHLVRLVDDLLDVSRITRGKIRLQSQVLDISQVIHSAVEISRPLIDASGHHLDVGLPSTPLYVQGDPSRLIQVFGNLLNNAAKFTPAAGRIELLVQQQGGEVVVRVRDNGAGIPPEMLTQIFELFTQVNHALDRTTGGLGVGLTLVRRLVELHHGSVQAISSGLEMGSEFIVRLPLHAAEGTTIAGKEAAPHEPHSRATRRVLLVDDNVDAVRTLSLLLSSEQHEVEVAHNGFDALHAAESFKPDVVLLDIGMPGLDGYELARRLRAHGATKDARLIALTGYGQAEDRRRAQQAGIDHFLVKPMHPDMLTEILACEASAP